MDSERLFFVAHVSLPEGKPTHFLLGWLATRIDPRSWRNFQATERCNQSLVVDVGCLLFFFGLLYYPILYGVYCNSKLMRQSLGGGFKHF